MMTHYRRSSLVYLGLVLVLLFALAACSSNEKKDSESVPTLAASITPAPTRTQSTIGLQPSPTLLPTWTPYPNVFPTATPLYLQPTIAFTQIAAAPSATPYPYDVRITYPVDGSQVAGYVTVVGSASHPRFVQYALEWGPDPNPGNLWYPIMSPRANIVLGGPLGAWNTTQVPDGIYQIRLHVWLSDGTEATDLVTGIRVSNAQPTAVPTSTPTQRPNNSPVINPIASQLITAGQSIKVPVTVSDPDGDAVNLFVASANTAVATAQVTGTTEITVTGVTAGQATITVTANDNFGGSNSAAFIVTVQGQNRAPVLGAISNQAITIGQTIDIPISASDPDGDSLTVTGSSANTAIATVAMPDNATVRVTGVGAGSTSVTVTASDGKGGTVNVTFQVTVQSGNKPPTVDAIPDQTMDAGATVKVPYNASDPDGDTLTALVTVDNPAVASADISTPGTIDLTANGPGTAAVSLSVSDNINAPVVVSFNVTVAAAANQPPTVNPIAAQTMDIGVTIQVPYMASDPEGDPLTIMATSDDPGVVTANVDAQNSVINLTANGSGDAVVTLSVSDGVNPAVEVPFNVTVAAAANMPPVVEPIAAQSMDVGTTIQVPYVASDPESDPLTIMATSNNPGIVTANVDAQNSVINLMANGAGDTAVTLSVSDGVNPAVEVPFNVTVAAAANQPPTVNPIPAQTMDVGTAIQVPYAASDPEGDPLTIMATSNNPGVVTANVDAQNSLISLTANGAGDATVTLSVSDGVNPAVEVPFSVSVAAAPNQPPVIQPVGDQTVDQNATITVTIMASDPDDPAVALTATSDNPNVVAASASGSDVTLTGVTPGTATVTVEASDGRGGTASVTFGVMVVGANNAPEFQQIPAQTLGVGEQISVPVVVTDPDGDPIVLTAISQMPGIVTAAAVGSDTVTLQGVAQGDATVELTADDGKGGVQTTTFTVSVSGPPPFNLMDYPVLPDISQQMVQTLGQVFQSGQANFGNRANAFSKAGDDAMASDNFMKPFATPGSYDLGNYGTLQDSVITPYAGTLVREATDPAINSFNVNSAAAGSGFGIDTLSAPAPGGPPCDAVGGGSTLGCELKLTKPAIVLISFSGANVTYLPPEQFRSELQALVVDSLSTYGVIPVLTTIPADPGYSTEALSEYNRAIVEVATQSGVPLWNLWRAMQEHGIGDPNSVSPDGPGNLTDPSLGYGFNVRNLTALQTLERVRQSVGIQ